MLKELYKCRGSRVIAAGWVAFMSENIILSHNRDEIIATIGDANYHNLYSFLSTGACGAIAYGYFRIGRGTNAFTKKRSSASNMIGFSLQALGLAGLSQLAPAMQIPFEIGKKQIGVADSDVSVTSTATATATNSDKFEFSLRCPINFRSQIGSSDLSGIDRISRHATLWSLGIFSLGMASTTIFIPEVVLFSFPIVYAFIGGEHQDYRYRRGSGGTLTESKEAITSNIPFLALIQGRQNWELLKSEIKWTNVALAIGLAIPLTLRQIRRIA